MEHFQQSSVKSPLLEYAVARLTPEVFNHPVWVRFGKKENSDSLMTVNHLLDTVRNLEEIDPGTACQVLLICAVYQNHARQEAAALRTSQQALVLSRKHNLAKELIWALWGICAILIQQEDYDQAGTHLVDLQATLSEQNEWILANFIDIFRQTFSQRSSRPAGHDVKSSSGHPAEFTFDWLLHWGFSIQSNETEFDNTPGRLKSPEKHTGLTQSFLSMQQLQGRWHTLLLAIRGELSVQWKKNDSPPAKRRFSLWGTILSSVRLYRTDRRMHHQADKQIPQPNNTFQPPTVNFLPPANASPPPEVETSLEKDAFRSSRINQKASPGDAATSIPVTVHMLGPFHMTIGDLIVKLPASRSLSLLKYLLLHHHQYISREVIMEVFWPDAEPGTARNNLNVGIHHLRKSLRKVIFLPVIAFQEGGYGFESNLQIWMDIEEFERCVQAGRQLESRHQLSAAVTEYETAIRLYQGDFLEQDPYAEWTILERERLRIAYLDTLDRLSQIYFCQERYADCVAICQLILIRDRCREDAHCLLMRCYCRQKQYHLALRQYQICVEALKTELDVEPMRETTQLHNQIRRGEAV